MMQFVLKRAKTDQLASIFWPSIWGFPKVRSPISALFMETIMQEDSGEQNLAPDREASENLRLFTEPPGTKEWAAGSIVGDGHLRF